MILGPERILACRNCNSLVRVFSLLSGNTRGAKIWTDGKMVAPMLPRPPAITKCRSCDTIFWLSDAEKLGYRGQGPKKRDPAWKRAPKAKNLRGHELFQAIDIGLGSTLEKEKHLRILTWWSTNDRYRNLWSFGQHEPDERCIHNMRKLSELFDIDDADEYLMKAEIARELGEFSTARNLLESLEDEDSQRIKAYLIRLCDKQITRVKRLRYRHFGVLL